LFGILLWAGIADLYNYKIIHSSPWGYFASDSVHNLYLNQNLYEVGNWKYSPSYIVAGYQDVINYVLPVMPHLNVNFAYASGLQVYDSLILLVVVLACLAGLLTYLIVKDYNIYVAYISTSLFVFLFIGNFYVAITWGQLFFVAGSFFLLASVLALRYLHLKNMPLVLGILVAAIFFTHTSEFFFFVGFIVVYLVLEWLSQKKINLTTIKKLAYSAIIMIGVSSYYMVIFKNTYFRAFGPSSYKLFTVVSKAGFRTAGLSDFGTLVIAILLIGMALALYLSLRQKHIHLAVLVGLYMLGIGFLNFVGIGNRAFQTRFFWPLYLSIFFGLTLYQVLRLVAKEPKAIFVSAVSIVLLLTLTYAYYHKIGSQGLLNQYHWDSFQWLKQNTERQAKIYFFYGDTYDQNAQLLIPARLTTYALEDGLVKNVQDRMLPRKFHSRFMLLDISMMYRKSFFSFGYHSTELNITPIFDADVCNYDYFVLDMESMYAPVLAQYNAVIRKVMLDSGYVQEAYSNGLVNILKNNNPGGDCIPKEGVKLS